MKTPIENANELINKFKQVAVECECGIINEMDHHTALQCALIAIEEVIARDPYPYATCLMVQEELEKMLN